MFKTLLKNTDWILVICVAILLVIGVIGIYSAGYNTDINKDEYIKQMIWIGISFVIMAILWCVDYNIFDIGGYVLYTVNFVLLIAVLFMPSLMGASSWFNLGGFLYQPSEPMKIGVILCAAKFISIYQNSISSTKKTNILSIIGISLIYILPVLLILMQPDFGTAMAFVMIAIFMLFKAGIKYRYILLGILIVIIMIPLIYFFVLNDNQQQRILVFLNPDLDPLGSGYNAIQSKIAVGSGMFTGNGLLKGAQTQFGYLPIKSTDFIFSVLSEEFGFILSSVIVIIYAILIIRIILVASRAKDNFASYTAIGIAGMFSFHFIENIGMTIGLLPITGIPLPFLSYGGSNMITNMIAIAIVLNISARKSSRTLYFE